MTRIAVLVVFLTSFFVEQGMAAPKMTPLNPAQHGFKFANTFVNDFVPALSIRTGGLCGGMSYAALDYYFSNMAIPAQDYRPANGTRLQGYLYNRQVDAIMSSLDRWAEFGFNPNGARNSEFFRWGLEGKPGGRIAELKSFIDQGKPVPLGLQGAGSTGNHYVIAIGYDMGRYQGDLGAYQQDFKIFVIDPNYPNEIKTLTPDLAAQVWCIPGYVRSDGTRVINTFQSYFVDKKYAVKSPTPILNRVYPNDGKLYELLLTFETGNDDLRGGNDNVDVIMDLFDGTKQYFQNVNLGSRWVPNYTETESILLSKPVPRVLIKNLIIAPTFGGGFSGDNWDMKKFRACALGGGGLKVDPLVETFFYRFTGQTKLLVVSVNTIPPTPPGFMGQLELTFETGTDDLRGGNDNVNVMVTLINGMTLSFNNVNSSSRWVDKTSQTLRLPIPINPPVVLRSITISTTFGGGIGGDNWNMNSFKAVAQGTGLNKEVARYGYKRFTGSDKSLTVNCTP